MPQKPDMQTLQFNIHNVPSQAFQEECPASGKSSLAPGAAQYMASSPPNVSGQELEFITTTGPPSERSQMSRDIVRSHVRRSFLLEQKGEGRAGPELDAEMDERHIGELKGKFRLATWSRRNPRKPRMIIMQPKNISQEPVCSPPNSEWDPETLGCTHVESVRKSLDPYSLLSMPLRPSTKRFLHRYMTSFMMNSAALNPDGTWISFAITDMVVLHSTMAIVAWHFDQMSGITDSSDTLQQKGDAIMLVNKRLRSLDHLEQVSDGIVGAVASFAIFETMNGTRNSSQMHMDGLVKMVTLRGGLTSFLFNPVLQRVLTWSDILYSSTWGLKPRFPLLQQVEDNNDFVGTLSRFASTPDWYSATLNARWFPSNQTLLVAIETMRRISRALSSPDLSRQDRAAISYRIHLTEHTLLSLHDDDSSSPKSDVSIITRDLSAAFCLAALLYFRISIRELPSTARMHAHLVHRIRCILEPSSSSTSSIIDYCNCNKSLELLAWIAFMGGATESESNDHHYFVGLVIDLCGMLGVQKKTELQARLIGICWREGLCDEYLCRLWDEMELSRPSNGNTNDP